jgi:hypothetical protein
MQQLSVARALRWVLGTVVLRLGAHARGRTTHRTPGGGDGRSRLIVFNASQPDRVLERRPVTGLVVGDRIPVPWWTATPNQAGVRPDPGLHSVAGVTRERRSGTRRGRRQLHLPQARQRGVTTHYAIDRVLVRQGAREGKTPLISTRPWA